VTAGPRDARWDRGECRLLCPDMALNSELGPVGAVVEPNTEGTFVDAGKQLEQLGFPTIWVIGGPLEGLGQLGLLIDGTQTARIASGILAADRFAADDVAAFYQAVDATQPGRFVLGLGGARGPDSFASLNAYLDRLDERGVPAGRRIMAALGPRSLDLARERAAGAFPVLVTPEYTGQARERLGKGPTLAVEQFAIVEADPERARAVGRGPLGFMSQLPFYQASFRRQGFDDSDIADVSDRLVDGLVAWGDVDSVAARITEHHAAGADHVAVILMSATPDLPTDGWAALAESLLS
jgi:probable F420-dependent oxidoreductase